MTQMEKPKTTPEILDPDKEYHLPKPETEIDKLLLKLHELITLWIQTQAFIFVMEYHLTLDKLQEIGWNGSLDVDEELPDDLMPQHYK